MISTPIIMRCRASASTGFGHLTRCRALADAFRAQGKELVMVGPLNSLQDPEDHARFIHWVEIDPSADSADWIQHFLETASRYRSSFSIIDDYEADTDFLEAMRSRGLTWLQFEYRFDQPILADFVINANPAASRKDYVDVRNPNTHFFLGPRYAILRPEFQAAHAQAQNRIFDTFPRRILLTFGGGDDRGAILFCLKALVTDTNPGVTFTVVVGKANPRMPEIRRWIDKNGGGRVCLLQNPPSMAEEMLKAHFAVMAGGTTTYEAAACGLPMMLLAIADNQVPQCKAWHDLGGAHFLGAHNYVNDEKLIEIFNLLKTSAGFRKKMSETLLLKVDGSGAGIVSSEVGLI